ncbi:MAG: hypothetical protein ACOYYS_08795 [Chloroflexota bacterium]
MKKQDVSQIAKEMTAFCQRQIMSVTLSPVKQAILIAVITAIAIPEPEGTGRRWWKPR